MYPVTARKQTILIGGPCYFCVHKNSGKFVTKCRLKKTPHYLLSNGPGKKMYTNRGKKLKPILIIGGSG